MTPYPTRAEARAAGMTRSGLAAQRRRAVLAQRLNMPTLTRRQYQLIMTKRGR